MTDPDALRRRLTDRWGLAELELVGSGLEFTVFRARGRDGLPVAVRLADRRFRSNANDPRVDTRALLVQEYAVTRHLSAAGFAVAEPVGLRLADDDSTPDVLVSRYVADDGSPLDGRLLGVTLARLHRLPPPPALVPVAAEGVGTARALTTRVLRRWTEVGHLVADWPAPPPVGPLAWAFGRVGTSGLVHLDVRGDNVRRVGGRIGALLDWSNALRGDATVEFGRLVEYARHPENDLDLPAVRAGYAQVAPLPPDDTPTALACRLDAALMLALVFLSEAPDPRRGPGAADRARTLAERFTLSVRR
ncbi:phosphotransferase [Micromonospora sp. WMMD882]|uniref:phosphotransferase family protein n=1 Tax=Micromonospora sp. WMMD882 TaxID=3015151 RepID=UPI00248C8D65|nr:phosphotransferase [Micromonospora sp. WMMD882]WBB80472.1 phosphotransferase [Micromonospora sp. WMMD882]